MIGYHVILIVDLHMISCLYSLDSKGTWLSEGVRSLEVGL